jgi:WD40 repeat protein
VAHDKSYHIRVWSLERGLERIIEDPKDAKYSGMHLDESGRWLALSTPFGPFYLWDLDGPPEAQPRRIISKSEGGVGLRAAIDPEERWLVVPREGVVSFCPLKWPRVYVIQFSEGHIWGHLFTPDNMRLLVRTTNQLAVLPLASGIGEPSHVDLGGSGYQLDISPDGRLVATTSSKSDVSSVFMVPLDGSTLGEPVAYLTKPGVWRWSAVFDPAGRYLATATYSADVPDKQLLEIVDLKTGEVRAYPLIDPHHTNSFKGKDWGVVVLRFFPDGSLLSCGNGGIRRWNIYTGVNEILYETGDRDALCTGMSRDGRFLSIGIYTAEWKVEDLGILDLERGTFQALDEATGSESLVDPAGSAVISGGSEGIVKVRPVSGSEPHLLFGHDGTVMRLMVSPDGRWIASATDAEIRIWPMPDVSQPPLQVLPHAKLMAKLDSFTNLRAVRDAESPSGWKLEIGPFPGWETTPSW